MSDISEPSEPSASERIENVDIDRIEVRTISADTDLNALAVLKEAANKASEIKTEHIRMLIVSVVAAASVASIAALSIYLVFTGSSEADWAKQILGTLLGFAAGALWPLSQSGK